jgi:flagellar hook-basal body complex protein FliE
LVEISSLSAAAQGVGGAYRQAQGLSGAVSPLPQGDEANSFAAMVRNATEQAATTIREGDRMAQLGLTGEAGTQQVVEATLALESTVRTVVAMRDRFVEAYQEVLRMPI